MKKFIVLLFLFSCSKDEPKGCDLCDTTKPDGNLWYWDKCTQGPLPVTYANGDTIWWRCP